MPRKRQCLRTDKLHLTYVTPHTFSLTNKMNTVTKTETKAHADAHQDSTDYEAIRSALSNAFFNIVST